MIEGSECKRSSISMGTEVIACQKSAILCFTVTLNVMSQRVWMNLKIESKIPKINMSNYSFSESALKASVASSLSSSGSVISDP